MIIAVAVVLMVQVAFNQVVDVIAMRYSLVPAVSAMLVLCIVAVAGMAVGAGSRIGFAHGNDVLVDVSLVDAMEMTVMEVIDVILMLNGGVSAVSAMLVGVVLMDYVIDCHGGCLSKLG